MQLRNLIIETLMTPCFRMKLSPKRIRFTQDLIAMRFGWGQKLNEVVDNIVRGHIDVSRFQPLDVFSMNNVYHR